MDPNENRTESHPHFPSGEWEGFYTHDHAPDKHPMACHLTFRDREVSGQGSDDVGAFIWKGQYDPAAGTCRLTKQYPGAHEVSYSGHADENGIWGRWHIGYFSSGGFHLWPRSGAEEEEEQEARQKETPKRSVTRSA